MPTVIQFIAAVQCLKRYSSDLADTNTQTTSKNDTNDSDKTYPTQSAPVVENLNNISADEKLLNTIGSEYALWVIFWL